MEENKCNCETCRQRKRLENEFPEKEIGLQYAYWRLREDINLLVSAEEIPYLSKEQQAEPIELLQEEKYMLVYGLFKSQTNFYENFEDLHICKQGSYFTFDCEKERTFEIQILDYSILSKKEDEAKVCLLIKVSEYLDFPRDQSELSKTFSKYMVGLGDTLENLIFSRIEYGVFRIDSGKRIDKKKIGHWKKQISSKKCFEIPYKRFLIIDDD